MSSIYFRQGFELREHPARVTIDRAEAHIWDQSGVTALDQVIRRLKLVGSAVAEEAGGRGGDLALDH